MKKWNAFSYSEPAAPQSARVQQPISLGELRKRSFADLKWVIADMLPEGTYILSPHPQR